LLGDFDIKVGREDIFKPKTGKENLHEITNNNRVRVVNFATSKILLVKSAMFPRSNIHKYTWTFHDGKISSQVDHILIDRRRNSSVLDVRSFRGVVRDTVHRLVAANVRHKLTVSTRGTQKSDTERFSLNKLNKVEGTKWYRVKISNRTAALENLDDDMDINRAWETIRGNIKISAEENLGYYKLKQQTSWFDEGCSKLMDRRKQTNLQMLQDPSQINWDNTVACRPVAGQRPRGKQIHNCRY
jgi:hypothetical protein